MPTARTRRGIGGVALSFPTLSFRSSWVQEFAESILVLFALFAIIFVVIILCCSREFDDNRTFALLIRSATQWSPNSQSYLSFAQQAVVSAPAVGGFQHSRVSLLMRKHWAHPPRVPTRSSTKSLRASTLNSRNCGHRHNGWSSSQNRHGVCCARCRFFRFAPVLVIVVDECAAARAIATSFARNWPSSGPPPVGVNGWPVALPRAYAFPIVERLRRCSRQMNLTTMPP